jgi:hypothetical protein
MSMNERGNTRDDGQMLATYGPGGVPRYYKREGTPIYTAVRAFIDGLMLAPSEFGLVKEYLRHWVMAPRWNWQPTWISRPRLCGELDDARTPEDLWAVLRKLLHINIDPL